MDFAGIVLFAIALYVRPQEFIGFLSALRPAQLSLAMAGLGLFIRESGISPKQIIRTPMDWMITAYFVYILVWTPGSFGELWGQIYPFVGFYFLVVLALTNFRRIYQYLAWWCGCVMFIAVMALLSMIGLDPLDSATTTAGSQGRLTLNTSLFSNPNGLGHSVMVAVPLLFFFMFWKRPIFVKEVGLPLIFLPMLCTYFTQSKGAAVSGIGAIIATLAFGRPKWVQFVLLPILLVIGSAALPLLPRFSDTPLGSGQGRNDEAVLGRIQAFEFGKWAFENMPYGVGYGNFYAAYVRKAGDLQARASHSSFNQVQAEFGFWGLLIFSGILYTCFHSLTRARTADDNEERVRRMLFCMLLSYVISSWMIDFGFRASLFVMVAMISAFHRILMDRTAGYNPTTQEQAEWGGILGVAESKLGQAGAGSDGVPAMTAQDYVLQRKMVRGAPTRPRQMLSAQVGVVAQRDQPRQATGYVAAVKDDSGALAGAVGSASFMPWPRFRWYDAVGIYLSLRLVLYIRDYAISL